MYSKIDSPKRDDVKEGLPLALPGTFSAGFTSFRVLLLLLIYQSASSVLSTAFDTVSSNKDQVLSSNPSANVFVFRDFSVHHNNLFNAFWWNW